MGRLFRFGCFGIIGLVILIAVIAFIAGQQFDVEFWRSLIRNATEGR
jgi:hypothetical protein